MCMYESCFKSATLVHTVRNTTGAGDSRRVSGIAGSMGYAKSCLRLDRVCNESIMLLTALPDLHLHDQLFRLSIERIILIGIIPLQPL